MNVSIEGLFLKALLVTDGIETVVLFLIVRLWFKIPRSILSDALLIFAGICCSATTLPYLWFVLPHYLHPYFVFLIVGELLVFLAEAVFYYFVLKIGILRSVITSFVCNAASLVAGFWLI